VRQRIDWGRLTKVGRKDARELSGDPPEESTSMCNIHDYGALGDGETLNTPAIQAAIDAATADGGGTVLVLPVQR
jgi:hypothetical protein